MKRLLIITILISYSITSFGVSLNYFYCCGKLKDVSLVLDNQVNSNKDKSKKGCCDNKKVTIKLDTNQKNTGFIDYHFNAPFLPAIIHTHDYIVVNITTNGNINLLYKRPPPDNLPYRNILFCVFRI